ncbi:NACHT domain-containing protein [Amycolatopsis sp. cg5]|uniref:NACHT domain-containing protein n=1 Tax=Amycolatopsis sp. cg5 TaxID=3238802 RepID=UPI0035263D99
MVEADSSDVEAKASRKLLVDVGRERVIRTVVNKLNLQSVTTSCEVDLLDAVVPDVAAEAQVAARGNEDDAAATYVVAAAYLLGYIDDPGLLEVIDQRGQRIEYDERSKSWKGPSNAKIQQDKVGVLLGRSQSSVKGPLWSNRIFEALERAIVCHLESDAILKRLLEIVERHERLSRPREATSPSSGQAGHSYEFEKRKASLSWQPELPARHIDSRLLRAKADLAESVERQLLEEKRTQRVGDPFPLPIRLDDCTHTYGDQRGESQRVQAPMDPVNLPGMIDNDISSIFERVPTKCLIVLGKPGSGKSVLLRELALSLLRKNSPTDRVPVIFNIGSWEPNEIDLRDWMAKEIVASHRDPRLKKRLAAALADQLAYGRHILPLFDGLDEAGEDRLEAVLRSIYASRDPDSSFIISSRVDEYRHVASKGKVTTSFTSAFLVRDLELEDVIEYLPRTSPARPSFNEGKVATKWDPVLARLKSSPDSPGCIALRRLFATPLMVSLARAIYSETDAHPKELLDFPDLASLSDHLLDNFVRARYEQPTTPGRHGRYMAVRGVQVERYLSFRAVSLLGQRRRDFKEDISDKVLQKKHRELVRSLVILFLFLCWSAATTIYGKKMTVANSFHSFETLTPIQYAGQLALIGIVAMLLAYLSKFIFLRRRKLDLRCLLSKFEDRLLKDAHCRGVLRRNGSHYQFRHSLLQDRLALNLLNSGAWIAKSDIAWKARAFIAVELYQQGRISDAEREMKESLRLQLTLPWMRWRYHKTQIKWTIEQTDAGMLLRAISARGRERSALLSR